MERGGQGKRLPRSRPSVRDARASTTDSFPVTSECLGFYIWPHGEPRRRTPNAWMRKWRVGDVDSLYRVDHSRRFSPGQYRPLRSPMGSSSSSKRVLGQTLSVVGMTKLACFVSCTKLGVAVSRQLARRGWFPERDFWSAKTPSREHKGLRWQKEV